MPSGRQFAELSKRRKPTNAPIIRGATDTMRTCNFPEIGKKLEKQSLRCENVMKALGKPCCEHVPSPFHPTRNARHSLFAAWRDVRRDTDTRPTSSINRQISPRSTTFASDSARTETCLTRCNPV